MKRTLAGLRSRVATDLPLLLAVALSAVPLIALAPVEGISYDGFWHVFIARQDDWGNLWDEIDRNAHPPLFYLLLKGVIAIFGPGPVTYRLIPVAASLGSTWLVGRIVRRILGKGGGRPWLAAGAALAFGTSLSAVSIGLDVRAYALCIFFMLWACRALVDLAAGGFAATEQRDRVLFAVMTTLALLTHYVAALFLLACCAAVGILASIGGEYRRRLLAPGRRLANLATFGVPLAILAVEYRVHFGQRGHLHHVAAFLFDPGRETVTAFLWRTTRALVELFVPALDYPRGASAAFATRPEFPAAAVAILVVVTVAAVGWLGFRPLREAEGRAVAGRIPPLLLAAMSALVVAAALLGRYPYGGWLRHQFFLFPFLLIVLAQALGAVATRFGRLIGGLAVALLPLAALLNAANWASHFRTTAPYTMQNEVEFFDELFPSPEVVYVEQFNIINLFSRHHRQRWRFVGRVSEDGPIDLWRVGEEGREFYVCRDRQHRFHLDLSRDDTYLRMRHCLEATGADRVTVLRTQLRGTTPDFEIGRSEELAARGADLAGLVLEKVVVRGNHVYAAFSRPEVR